MSGFDVGAAGQAGEVRPAWKPRFDLYGGDGVTRNLPAEGVLVVLWTLAMGRRPDPVALQVRREHMVSPESPEYGLMRFEVGGMTVVERDPRSAGEGARP